jgi:hypothetical protein
LPALFGRPCPQPLAERWVSVQEVGETVAGLATVLLPPLMNSVVLVGVGSGFLLWQAFESPSSGPCPLLGRAAVDGRLGAPSWGGVRRLAKVSHPLTGEPTLKAFGRMVAEGTLQGPGQNGTTPRSTFGGLELRLEGFSGPRRQRPRLTVLAACGAALPARGPFRRELTAFFFLLYFGYESQKPLSQGFAVVGVHLFVSECCGGGGSVGRCYRYSLLDSFREAMPKVSYTERRCNM